MFELTTGHSRNCEGVTRRDFIKIGGLTAFGLGLPEFLRARAAQASDKKTVSCILLWMDGGPSHIDTFDPKPEAPTEITGGMKAISTNVPGIQISEWLPKLAQVQDKYSIMRSLTSPDGSHGTANHYLQTGYRFTPVIAYPTYGAVVARERGTLSTQGLPSHVLMGNRTLRFSEPGGYMGAVYNPFSLGGDPNSPRFTVRDFTLPQGLAADRVERRRSILQAVDTYQRDVEARAASMEEMDKFYENAFTLTVSSSAKKAFDLSQESAKVRDRYGRHTFGQSCLLARRLVEAGVHFVTVNRTGWDTHTNNFTSLKNNRLPEIDDGYSALLADLDERGLLDSTLVIWMGEFGRTPKVNTSAGRDHWPYSLAVCLGGGGLKTGIAVGESTERAEYPKDRPYRVDDLAATIYKALGIDVGKEFVSQDGRPHIVNATGQIIRELI